MHLPDVWHGYLSLWIGRLPDALRSLTVPGCAQALVAEPYFPSERRP